MSAAQLIAEVATFGGVLSVNGDRLRIASDVPLPDDLLSRLKIAKPALIDAIRRASSWDDSDWRDFYEERAAIIEYDGGLHRYEAEQLALQHCIVEWLNRSPAKAASSTYSCVHCDKPVICQNGVALAIPEFAHGAWVHNNCIEGFHAQRRTEALDALRRCGVLAAICAQ